MRMTRRVKPPTAAVTITNTWPWSEAMSDAEGGGEWRMVRKKGKHWAGLSREDVEQKAKKKKDRKKVGKGRTKNVERKEDK